MPLRELAAGARVGTGAPRRVAQVLAVRPDLTCVPVRGNVDTRLGRVREGDLDGVVLAYAGLARLGRANDLSEALDPEVMLPAPAQGALAVECRSSDSELHDVLAALDDPLTRVAVTAERAMLSTLEAGCAAPVGAYTEVCDVFGEAHLHLHGAVIATDGGRAIRRSLSIPLHDAASRSDQLGQRLAAELLSAGAAALMGV